MFPFEHTCCIVEELFPENPVGFKFAWCKILEESFPGCVYGFAGEYASYESLSNWTVSGSIPIHNMYVLSLEFYQYSHTQETRRSPNLRIELMDKLLAQPDRTLVVPVIHV